ncbi:MAG: DNA-deoxyinosine glycosylase [Bacilli bacterium]|nr:DNA-deoxyinosine glycosylase [Bacilli bacterium]
MLVNHSFDPVYDSESLVLILGTMPSIKSREFNFYYAHPRNRFWKTLASVYSENIGDDIDSKKKFLHRHHIALFDVLASCDINASSDSSIKNPVVNDFTQILSNSKIKTVFTTGCVAFKLYQKYCYPNLLPSPSPANCKKNIDQILVKKYSEIRKITQE